MHHHTPLMQQAANLAREAHAGQKYGKKDYFLGHIIPVVQIALTKALELGVDEATYEKIGVCAYLHDVPEDCKEKVSRDTMIGIVGEENTIYAECLNQQYPNNEWKPKDIYYKDIAGYIVTQVTKYADRKHNLTSILQDLEIKSLSSERVTYLYNKYLNDQKYLKQYNIFPEEIDEILEAIKKNM